MEIPEIHYEFLLAHKLITFLLSIIAASQNNWTCDDALQKVIVFQKSPFSILMPHSLQVFCRSS